MVQSGEWSDLTDGEHYRELLFVHLAGQRSWHAGAIDLYRPGEPAQVVDFKTHPVKSTDEAKRVLKDYAVQEELYREAAGMVGEAGVRFVFTKLMKG